ncbi:MAG TPA: hypothetical protein DEP87_03060 [Candidatus Pacebacteria bacterium]|nr:hypothetical protein [Candidatus Paceibacterota bacterium]
MATRELSDLQFIKVLERYQKSYFTVADLQKILSITGRSIYVTISRLIKSGALVKLNRGIFQVESQTNQVEQTANQLYYPSYISFESALAIHGILSQQPFEISLATTQRSKHLILGDQSVVYHQVKPVYFFGFTLKSGRYIAEPEKALLDQLYLISRGQAINETNEWSLIGMDKEKLLSYAAIFPQSVQTKLPELLKNWNTYAITNQDHDRIEATI